MKQVGMGEGLQESKKSLWLMLFVLRVTTGPEIRGTLVCRNRCPISPSSSTKPYQ